MRSIWSCAKCVALLLGAVVPFGASASHLRAKELVHRVEKVFVTDELVRRDESCPANYSLCPQSLNGGCCPDRYGCETDSCVATTAGTTSACGKQGYFACGIDDGGGCCPEGFICGLHDCSAPLGSSNTQLCPVNYYLCPSSFNYGCCQNGMACALSACYATTPVTYIFTQTFTTTTDGYTLTTTMTATTVTTQAPPTGLPSETAAAWPKFFPSTQPKASATSVPSNDNQGLTTAQLGGIIGGAIGLLLVVLAATFFILRRLRKTAQIVEASRKASSSADQPSRTKPMAQYHRPTPSQVDQMEYDELLQAPANGAGGGPSSSPSEFSSTNPTPFPSASARHTSMESARGYFDIPNRVQNRPGRRSVSSAVRTSVDSHNTNQAAQSQQHGRNLSNASELSEGSNHGGVGSPLLPAELGVEGSFFPELPATPIEGQGRRRSSSGVSPLSPATTNRPPLSHQRRSSGSGSHVRDRSGSSVDTQQPPHLAVVSESVEHLHGYYGPPSVAAGQTRAAADIQYDISSPIAPRGRGPPLPPSWPPAS